jgi:hypothetical protein
MVRTLEVILAHTTTMVCPVPGSKAPQFPLTVGPGTWLDAYTWRDDGDGSHWLTRNGVAATYADLPATSLRRWARKPCRFLAGRKIGSRRVDPPGPRSSGRVRVYRKEDLDALDRARQPAGPDAPPRPGWLTAAQVVAQYGVSRKFCGYWQEKDSTRRSGKALRRAWAENATQHRGSPRRVRIYNLEDVEAIQRGEESQRPGAGRPANPQLGREARDGRAEEVLKAILAGGPLPSTQVIRQARQHGVGRPSLYRARKLLGVTVRGKHGRGNQAFAWCLPDQEPGRLTASSPASSPALAGDAPGTPGQTDDRPPNPKHLKWKAQKDAGMSFGQIVDQHQKDSGEVVTREAIANALRRLKKRLPAAGRRC